jgi:hypothetical protein
MIDLPPERTLRRARHWLLVQSKQHHTFCFIDIRVPPIPLPVFPFYSLPVQQGALFGDRDEEGARMYFPSSLELRTARGVCSRDDRLELERGREYHRCLSFQLTVPCPALRAVYRSRHRSLQDARLCKTRWNRLPLGGAGKNSARGEGDTVQYLL